jgi:hypothetical protein
MTPFEAPFVRVLVLYSNTLEDPGVIANAHIGKSQIHFLDAALKRIKKEGVDHCRSSSALSRRASWLVRIEYHATTDGTAAKSPGDHVTVDLATRKIARFAAPDLGRTALAAEARARFEKTG